MSKSKGNAVEPWQVLDTYGADALRWYFFTSKQPWDGYRFAAEAIGEGVRLFLSSSGRRTTSTRSTRGVDPAGPCAGAGCGRRPRGGGRLDRWALSRTAATASW